MSLSRMGVMLLPGQGDDVCAGGFLGDAGHRAWISVLTARRQSLYVGLNWHG